MATNYEGSLELYIDAKKTSLYQLRSILKSLRQEDLSYSMRLVLDYEVLENKYNYTEKDINAARFDINDHREKHPVIAFLESKKLSDIAFHDFDISFDKTAKFGYIIPTDFVVNRVDHIVEKDLLSHYVIWIDCDTSDYIRHNCEESILKFIDAMKPYRYEGKYCDDNHIGYIESSNGEYFREFVWNQKAFDLEQKIRDYICNDCKQRMKYKLCPNFSMCKRAYDLGYSTAFFTLGEE